MKAFLLSLLIGAPMLVAAGAQAEADLFTLSGEWRGSGAIVTAPGKPGREGRCRLHAMPLVEGREIRFKGRCATDQGSAELSMRFVLLEGGVLAGGIASSAQPGTVQYSGRLDGNIARLTSRESVLAGDMRATSNISLKITDENSFRLRQWLTPEDGAPPVAMVEMNFMRTGQ